LTLLVRVLFLFLIFIQLNAKASSPVFFEARTAEALALEATHFSRPSKQSDANAYAFEISRDTTFQAISTSENLVQKSVQILPPKPDTTKLVAIGSLSVKKDLDELVTKSSFTKNVLGYFITSQRASIVQTGVQSSSYFKQFSGKTIASIRFIRLHPFGTSLQDTSMVATKWIEKTGNRLHMNTARIKLGEQLLFKSGEAINPLLMAENEKLMRDLSYLEDVSFRLDIVEDNPDEVNVIIITKDKFEYGVSMSISADNSDVDFVNANMFGLGHHFDLGMAQKNSYLPEMGIYFSYQVNNILGQFVNSSIGYSDTYLKKGWNVSAEKQFLTSKGKNAGGFSYEHVSKYNYIAEDHPIQLDTTVAYVLGDAWFLHAFHNSKDQLNKILLSLRYYHQQFDKGADDSFGKSEFLRNHDFFVAGLSFSRRNLYKNSLIYGYGVTEDIPFGHYYQISGGLDKSQFGTWPYLGISLNKAFIDKDGRYYSGKFAVDGFLDNRIVQQGTVLASLNFFSKKFYVSGDPFRGFINLEFLGGINRFREEYLTIDGRFGIRDFHANKLRGNNRLKLNIETVRYLRWNFYGFKFTNYLYTDCAFLSNDAASILTDDFYMGIGTGLRIYNESLVFKIIDIRLSWFPLTPPEGMSPFGTNLQGLIKSRFDDFMGRKPELIRYQ
jgi:hypothetical protein